MNCRGDDDVDAKRSRPSIGKTRKVPREERARAFGRDSISESHQGQRPQWLHSKAGYMAAPERFAETSDSPCTAGAVHTGNFGNCNWKPGPACAIFASMAGHVVIRITERLGGGEPLRTAYAVAEPNQHRAIALFKLRPDHTADEQVEAVAELTQSALDSLGIKPGMIKPL